MMNKKMRGGGYYLVPTNQLMKGGRGFSYLSLFSFKECIV